MAANRNHPRLADIRIDGSYADELMLLAVDETVVDIEDKQTNEKKGRSKAEEVEVEVREGEDAPLLGSLSDKMEELFAIRTNHTISILKIMVFGTRNIRATVARKEGKVKSKRKKNRNMIDKSLETRNNKFYSK